MSSSIAHSDSITLSLELKPQPTSDYKGSHEQRVQCTNFPLSKPPNAKVTRMRVGRLACLKDMPMDIFFEIVMKLHPLDLLRLSRASKYFRELLLGRSSRHLWLAAFGNVPGIPSCSRYIPEPRYAAVLFDQYCFACGNAHSSNVDYSVCIRLCKSCYKANFVSYNTVFSRSRVVDGPMGLILSGFLKTLPMLCVVALHGLPEYRKHVDAKSNGEDNTIYLPEFEAVIKKINSISYFSDLEVFFAERIAFVTEMQTHGVAVFDWFRDYRNQKRQEQKCITAERKATILERLAKAGYGPGDYPDNGNWRKVVERPTPLTERAWKIALPKLTALIEQKHADDLQAALEALIKTRRAEFRPLYDAFVQDVLSDTDRIYAPNWHDACSLPSVVELIMENNATSPVTQERVSHIVEHLVVEIREAASRIKHDLVEMLFRDMSDRDPSCPAKPLTEEALTTYFALFVCHRCLLTIGVSASSICAHWRGAHPTLKWNDGWPIDECTVNRSRKHREQLSRELPWVSALRYGHLHTSTALAALGIPEDTPLEQLDSWVQEGRLICTCAHPRLIYIMETGWGGLMHHLREEQNWHDTMTTLCLGGPRRSTGELFNSHCLSGATPCLKLLAEGEQAAVPEFAVPDDIVAEINALLEARSDRPVCRTCYGMANPNSWHGLYLEQDVEIIAHHMHVRHRTALTRTSIYFP